MGVSTDIISEFVKITNDKQKNVEETTVYGTAVEYEGSIYVRLDGSELLTPISTSANVVPGERVTVMIKNHTATVTGNLSSPSARIADLKNLGDDIASIISDFEIVLAQKVDTEELVAERARIDALVADDVVIKESLTAAEADIDVLQTSNLTVTERLEAIEADIEELIVGNLDVSVLDAKYATIESLNATNANVYNLETTYGSFASATADRLSAAEANITDLTAKKLSAADADISYAKIAELDAVEADIDLLQAGVAEIDTLIFGSASGNVIQSSFANAVIAQLGDAQIKSAMIQSIAADKITAGDIITNNVRVMSRDGSLVISDETVQIHDGTRVRVQIGKDMSNDYSINIWDANGNLMFSKGGITDSAIKSAIIRNDMVSDTANIAAHKLDIDSLFEEINGSTNTIKSTQIYLDDQAQTLNVAFKELTTDVSNLDSTVSSQGTQLSIIQGQINSMVWQQDINDVADQMSTQYSALEQEVYSVSATVALHTTAIENKADSTTVTNVSNKVTSLETNLSGFKTTVSETYATKNDLTDLDIGGRNLVAGTDDVTIYSGNNTGATTGYKDVWSAKTIDIPTATEYIVSFDAKADIAQTIRCHFYSPNTTLTSLSSTGQYRSVAGDGTADVTITTEWARYWVKWTQTPADAKKSIIVGRNMTENDIHIRAVKLEVGNKATAWSPAPEDMVTGKELVSVENTLESTRERMTEAESLIQQLSESIMTLVTDGNGESLMVQTESGWTFSTGQIQDMINSASENLNSLTNEMGDVNTTVNTLRQAVADLGVLNDYVKIGTYENEPCIELGENDSDFKLMITNTRIMFMEGSSVPAYINNQSLFIKKAVIEEELQQGEFVWKARSNGNLGLIWKGVTS